MGTSTIFSCSRTARVVITGVKFSPGRGYKRSSASRRMIPWPVALSLIRCAPSRLTSRAKNLLPSWRRRGMPLAAFIIRDPTTTSALCCSMAAQMAGKLSGG